MKKALKNIFLVIAAKICRDGAPKVVFYHDIGKKWTPMGTEEEVFWRHMQCLRPGDVVCFDDGFRGVLGLSSSWRKEFRVASCEFRVTSLELGVGSRGVGEFGVRVVVFIAVGLVGKPGYLTWDEIRELQDKHGIEFQCHTWSHQTLAGPYNMEVPAPEQGRTEEWYHHELVDSKVELERRLGRPVTALCLPVGYFSDEVITRCKAAGYEQVYASYPGNVTSEYVQPRCLVQDLSVSGFKAVLNGGMNWLKARYLRRHKIG